MVPRLAAICAGVGLAASGLMPWTRDGLSGAYVAGGLGGLLVLVGIVVAGIGLAAPRNRLAKWSVLVLSAMTGLFGVWAIGIMGSEVGVAFFVLIVSSGLGVLASLNWVDHAPDADRQASSA